MSNEAITWSLRVQVPKGHSSAKHVLFVMANQANGDPARGVPVLSWASIAYIVDATSQDRKTVISNIAKLREWGLIEDTGQRVGRTKQVIVYALNIGPDLLSSLPVEEFRNRCRSTGRRAGQEAGSNGPNIGTVPKSEPSQYSAETVPILVGKGPNIGTRNPRNPKGTGISPDAHAPDDRDGQLEGHAGGIDGSPAEPTAAGRIAATLRRLGYRITSHDPDLLSAVADGVTVDHITEFAELYPADHAKCRGSAGYVIGAARRQLAESTMQTGDSHANSHPAHRAGNGSGAGHHPRQRESRAARAQRRRAEAEARIGVDR